MIKITDTYYIDTDTYNWILVKKSIGEKGKVKGQELFSSWRFFPSLESLLFYVKGLQEKELASSYNDLDKYIAKISKENKKWRDDFSRLCEGIKKEHIRSDKK